MNKMKNIYKDVGNFLTSEVLINVATHNGVLEAYK